MSRAKKVKFKAKFKPGTLVKYKDGSGVSGEVIHTIDGGEYGNRVFYKAGGWDREQMLMPVKPKKPKPARVWSVSYGALHLNGKYKTGLMCDAADLLNAYERKIRRLEGR